MMVVDSKDSRPGRLVFNRTLGLRHTWATSFSAIKSRSRRLWLRKYGTLPTAVEFYILADGGQVTKLR